MLGQRKNKGKEKWRRKTIDSENNETLIEAHLQQSSVETLWGLSKPDFIDHSMSKASDKQ